MKRRFLRTFLISLVLFSVLWTGIIYRTLSKADSAIEEEDKDTLIDRLLDGTKDITFLVLGVDAKDVADSSGARSDTMMLCKVDRSTGDISILSIPRDTKAQLPGRVHEEKINHAHAYGGPEYSVMAVSELLGIDLEYYVKVDYNIVREYVNILGGVEIDVPMDMQYTDLAADPPLYIDLKQGYQTLDGDKALQFLRFRKGYIDQDLGRIRAQQQFMKAALEKTLRPANIVNIPKLMKSYYKNVDTNIPLDVIMKFALNAKRFDAERLQVATLPGDGRYIGDVSYFVPDEEESRMLIEKMFLDYRAVENINDDIDEYNEAN
ncbi:MAG TPA: LCP family protein [Tepidimicrobium sp.]|nr:LCP family protein [Tepidimicrobium sp.]